MPNPTDSVTELLHAWRGGDREALNRLIPLVHDELHRLAAGHMRSERPDHTLQTTALVDEAYLRLVDAEVDWTDRAHFLAVAATVMRRVLVDHARGRDRGKRAGVKVTLEEAALVSPSASDDMLALDEALSRLATHDERAARAVELHYFGGLTYREIGEVLDVSEATVDRDLRLARAWLYNELRGGE
jgi:RNA polymerase sigma-70 factor, ECF subfamily